MLWAALRNVKGDIPDEWDIVHNAYRFLQKYTHAYQLVMERRMFGEVEYRCSLIRWVDGNGNRMRDVLFETTDPKHAELMLTVLISEAKHDSQRG